MRLHDTVVYDAQRNSFYRINKDSGRTFLTYKNGQPLKSFKPSVTGFDYHIRKSEQKRSTKDVEAYQFVSRRIGHKEIPKKLLPRFNKTLDYQQTSIRDHSHFMKNKKKSRQTVPVSLTSSPRNYSSGFSQYQSISSSQKPAQKRGILSQTKALPSIFLSTITPSSIQESTTLTNSQSSCQNINILNQTLKKFTDICKQKRCHNNSPRKDSISGNSPQKQHLDALGTTMNSFKEKLVKKYDRNEDCLKTPNTIQVKINERIPESYSPKCQKERQCAIFYRFHPEFIFKENHTSMEKQKDRSKNVKKLEKLFISQNDKSTSKIYS